MISAMLKFKSVLAILFSTLLLTACGDSLFNEVPEDQPTDPTFWKTEEDFEIAVNGVYPYLQGIRQMIETSALTDDSHHNFSFDVFYDIGNGSATSDSFDEPWYDNYEGIRRTNTVLNRIDDIDWEDEELKDQLIAETRALRAYLYYDLTFKYGDVPLVTTEITIEEGHEEPQESHEDVVDFVLTELEEAAEDLPASYSGSDEGKITSGAAKGLLARYALYEEDYELARDAAQEVIESEEYELLSDYEDVFSYEHENSSEVLLANEFESPDHSHNVFQYFAPPSLNGDGGISPLRSLVNAYEVQSTGEPIDDPDSGYDPENPFEDRDPRLDASLIRPGTDFAGRNFDDMVDEVDDSFNHTSTGLYVKKYLSEEDADDPDNSGLDLIVLRYAEILLTYAEAKIELNDIDASVYEAIDEVRTRADMPSIGTSGSLSQDELREKLRHERRVEFAFEGHRFYDIRRWEIADDVLNGDAFGIDRDGNIDPEADDSDKFFVGERVFNDKHYLFAIPQDEVELNDNLEQNSGW